MNRWLTSTSLVALLGLTSAWIGNDAIAPSPAYAYVSRVDVAIDVFPGETYETVLRRAESVARAAAQRSFDRDILISEVAVIVVGKNRGASVQVLTLQASRAQWRGRPDPRRWAIYYPAAKVLLGLRGGSAPGSPSASPTVSTQPTSPPETQPPASVGPAVAPVASPEPTPSPIPSPSPIAPPAPIGPSPNTTPLPPSR
jgi:hypothetical protein